MKYGGEETLPLNLGVFSIDTDIWLPDYEHLIRGHDFILSKGITEHLTQFNLSVIPQRPTLEFSLPMVLEETDMARTDLPEKE